MLNSRKFLPSLIAGSILLIFTLFVGCKKDNDSNDDITTTAEDIGQAETVSADVDNMVDEVARMSSFSTQTSNEASFDQFNFSSCATVTNDSINHILTFDFGAGCTGRDGKTRSGQTIVTYSGSGYFSSGSAWTVTFNNFYVNGKHIEGSRSVVNNGIGSDGNMSWTINVQNMKITKTNGSWRSWSGQRTREIVAGFGDSTWTNDVYLINGSFTGINSNGESVTGTLSNIRRDHSCHYITSGTIAITPSGKPTRTIDFGNGTCDDLATVTRNGVTRNITL
jgi:hypothetical protein